MSVPAPRSLFVTLTAWSLIILGILGVLVAAFIGLAWSLLLDAEQRELFATLPMFQLMPPSVQWILAHFGAVCLLLLAMGIAAIPLGQALLQRRSWARVASVWSCVVLALLHLIALPWQWFEIERWYAAMKEQLPWFAREGLASVYWSTQISAAVFALVFALGFAWTAWKLATPTVRSEFMTIK